MDTLKTSPGGQLPTLAGSHPRLRFDAAQSEAANNEWKATCGPHSIAAACSLTLDAVRPVLVNYKGWMSPTQMTQALATLGTDFRLTKELQTRELCNGINRIQWEGKWLNPGAPPRLAYFHTHYVAHFDGWVLCTTCLSAEWIPVQDWLDHLASKPPSPFHVTHHWALPKAEAHHRRHALRGENVKVMASPLAGATVKTGVKS